MPYTVRTAIAERLLASSAVTSLLGVPDGIFHRKAPQATRPPVVIFQKQSGRPSIRFMGGGVAIDAEFWIVKAIAFGRLADRAEDIAVAIDASLTDAPLALTGRTLLECVRESDVDYPEQIGKEIFQHTGAIYRVTSKAVG